jgi:hypothetical protein
VEEYIDLNVIRRNAAQIFQAKTRKTDTSSQLAANNELKMGFPATTE